MAVKIAICQHLPILVYNENISSDSTSDSKSNWDCRQGALRTSQAPVQGVKSCISSIYLDDPLSLPNYRRRLGKEDGATVLRVRWYGDEASHRQINSPTASTVFLERKVRIAIALIMNAKQLVEVLDFTWLWLWCVLRVFRADKGCSAENGGCGISGSMRMLGNWA